MIRVPELQFVPAQPANLTEVLESQIRRLIECGVPQEVGVDKAKFLDDAMKMSDQFAYSTELAGIGLDRVAVMPYGARECFLREASGVVLWHSSNNFTLFEGVTVPESLRVVQFQFGPKYQNCRTFDVRRQHAALEELGTPEEGLTAYLYWGEDLLGDSFMGFPGTVAWHNSTPCLWLYNRVAVLSQSDDLESKPRLRSFTVFRGR